MWSTQMISLWMSHMVDVEQMMHSRSTPIANRLLIDITSTLQTMSMIQQC
jgi:hypothetical protein